MFAQSNLKMSVKVDLLSKEELLYEVKIRGVEGVSECKVVELRKKLRQLVALNVMPSSFNLKGKINYQDEVEKIKQELAILSGKVEDSLDLENTLEILRCQAKIKHWEKRIETLNQLFKIDAAQGKTLKTLSEKFEELLAKIVSANLDKEQSVLVERKLSESNLELENELFSQDKSSEAINACSKLENEVFTPDRGSMIFGKVPNPVERYVKNLRVYDGLNVMQLLEFLKILLKIKAETQLNDKDILEIVVGHCTGPLLSKLIEYKQIGLSVNQVHVRLVGNFVPFTHLERLKFEMLHRPQRHNESLSSYILEIRENVKLLCCDIVEKDVVEMIKVGINPETRNKLVFVGNPTTFGELEEICIRIQNISYSDYMRRSSRAYEGSRLQVAKTHQVQVSARNVTCYNCRKVGHMAKDCRLPKTNFNPPPRMQQTKN